MPAPKSGALTQQQIFDLIADLKKSELEKSLCGKRLIQWVESR